MQRYIEQLITDIHKATWNIKPPHLIWEESEADPANELELEDISYVEEFLYGTKIPIAQITGIDCDMLPPPEKLSAEQQSTVAIELERLLQVFNFYLDFPAGFPDNLKYPFILKCWNESHVPISFGQTHIEFCDYDETKCPFRSYCSSCEEYRQQMEVDEKEYGIKGKNINWEGNFFDFFK
jgi:hypothetical protein